MLSALLHLLQLIFLCLAFYYLKSHSRNTLCHFLFPLHHTLFSFSFTFVTYSIPSAGASNECPSPAEGVCPLFRFKLWSGLWQVVGSCQIWCMIACLLLPREMALVLWRAGPHYIWESRGEAGDEGPQKGTVRKTVKCQLSVGRVGEDSSWGSGTTCMMKRWRREWESREENLMGL